VHCLQEEEGQGARGAAQEPGAKKAARSGQAEVTWDSACHARLAATLSWPGFVPAISIREA
jgi:hypothetical protein